MHPNIPVRIESEETDPDRFHAKYKLWASWLSPDSGVEKVLQLGSDLPGHTVVTTTAAVEEMLRLAYDAGVAVGVEQALDDLLRK